MAQYAVTFREIHSFTKVVEASSEEEAIHKVQEIVCDPAYSLDEPDRIELDDIEDWYTEEIDPLADIVGKRIRLIAMPDDPDPVPPGTMGTVLHWARCPGGRQLWVKWDINRSLHLSVPPDQFEIVE
jgi:hypothetical protein